MAITFKSVNWMDLHHGVSSKFGFFVAGYSGLCANATIATGTAETLTRVNAYINGRLVVGVKPTGSAPSYSATLNPIIPQMSMAYSYLDQNPSSSTYGSSVNGKVSIRLEAVLSNGTTANYYETVDVSSYSAVRLTKAEYNSTKGTIDLTWGIDRLGLKNTGTVTVERQNGTSWTQVSKLTANSSNTANYAGSRSISVSQSASPVKYRVTVEDSMPTTTTAYVTVPSNYELVSYGAGGKSIALGKKSSNDGRFEVAMPADFQAGLTINGTELPEAYKTAIRDMIYPIGSVIATYTNKNPSSSIGGTWTAFAPGRVLIGVGTGSDGYSSRTFSASSTGGDYVSKEIDIPKTDLGGLGGGSNYNDRTLIRKTAVSGTAERNGQISLIQPYATVYYWRRTA